MSDILLNLQAGTLTPDCYPASADDFQRTVIEMARAVLPNGATRVGDTPPTDTDAHSYPWFKTDSSGNLVRVYTWGGYGVWVSQYQVPASGSERRLWVGALADLRTYDEGNGTTDDGSDATPTTGAFWMVDHAFDGRFPIGAGTLPSTTVIGVTDTGGEEKHSLTEAEMPPHTHDFTVTATATTDSGVGAIVGGEDKQQEDGTFSGTTESTGGTGDPVAVTPHNNMPPYYGVYIIRRTARQYYVG